MRLSPALLLSLMTLGAGAGTLAWGLDWQPDLSTAEVAPVPAPQQVQAARTDMAQDEALIQVLRDRPPFTPGRRPPRPAATLAIADSAAPEAVADLPVPTVRGIAVSGQSSIAVVALESQNSRLHRVPLGGEIGGWRVTAIKRGSVTFTTPTIEAVAHLSKPGEEPRVETTRHDSEVAAKEDPDIRKLVTGHNM
jgi:hypothetical protein